jgi:hypothetical protein
MDNSQAPEQAPDMSVVAPTPAQNDAALSAITSSQPATPAYTGGGDPTADLVGDKLSGGSAPNSPKPRFWQSILMGALHGMAGSAGATSFGAGLAGGVKGEFAYQQQDLENRQRQQQLDAQTQDTQSTIRFRNAQAASFTAEAAMRDAQLHALPEQLRQQQAAGSLSIMKELDALGIRPTLVTPNTSQGAEAGLQQLTQSHDGVPPLFTLNIGDQLIGYDLSQLSQAPQGLSIINQVNGIQGKPTITQDMWNKIPTASRTQLMNNAITFWDPVPTKENVGILYQQYQNNLDTYKKDPNADPGVLGRLQSIVDNLKKTQSGLDQHELDTKTNEAQATATAQQGARLEGDRKWYQTQVKSDITGWTPPVTSSMSEQQFNAAREKFVNGTLVKAKDVEKSYQMFQDAYAETHDVKGNYHSAGTGAQGMLALSTHLATTFGNVKGSRVTKDMIEHHLGARSITDAAWVAAQKVVDGEPLSPQQWDAFRTLITDSRNLTRTNTLTLAHAQGLPVTADMGLADPVQKDGKLIGWTTDGKTMTPVQGQ